MALLELTFPNGGPALDVRRFAVREAISTPFTVDVWAVAADSDVDLAALIGQEAVFRVVAGWVNVRDEGARTYRGICRAAAQGQAETTGLSSYEISIVPALWRLSTRRDHRIFQHRSVPDVVSEILDAWQIPVKWALDRAAYPTLEYRVQHGESDLAFVSRLLEDAGIAYTFPCDDPGTLVLSDAPQGVDPRPGPPIHFVDNPNRSGQLEYVTGVRSGHEARPGAEVLRDHDFRRPDYPLLGEATAGPKGRSELYGYAPGASVIEGQKGGDTPVADDQSVARASDARLDLLATRRLEERRLGERTVVFGTNALDLAPGTVFSIARHERLPEALGLLVTDLAIDGTPGGEWRAAGRAVFADKPFRPPQKTPRARAYGLMSAFVVGPPDQEIHVDELGRVRVRFVWDRSGKADDTTSCWLRVSHAWAGRGFGWIAVPRVGQEVLVTFLDGDPDQPIILAGAHNGASPPPHPLPDFADASAWRSASTPGSDGFNEILFRDVDRKELVYHRAERDESRLVRYDETVTIGRRRSTLVTGDRSETTGLDRARETVGERRRRVNVARSTRIEGKRLRRIAREVHRSIAGSTFSRVDGGDHRAVHGEARIRIDGKDSLAAGGDRHEVIEKRHAIEVKGSAHLLSRDEGVIEGVKGITFKTPGGILVIDAGGIVIKGPLVKINSGGAAGSGGGARPDDPSPPREVERFDPPMPYEGVMPDDDLAPIEVVEAPPEPIKPPVKLSWIEIYLHDGTDDRNPVAGERYRVTTPDGKVREGRLDSRGRARVEGIVPGDCQVTFPDLDQEDWK